jgi:hypothetical protein
VEVDRVFASDDVSDGAALGLAGGLLGGGHFCGAMLAAVRRLYCAQLRKRGRATAARAYSVTASPAMYVLTEIGCGLVDGDGDAA